MKKYAVKLFYAPGDWIGTFVTSRQRRAAAMWLLMISVLLTPVSFIWKDAIWMIWLISILAIWLSLGAVVAAETPDEVEKGGDRN